MKQLLSLLLIVCWLCGCAGKSETQSSIGPYYYMSAPPNEGYRPPGDLTETEAKEIAARGMPVYMAYFDTKGQPEKILKVSAGGTEVVQE